MSEMIGRTRCKWSTSSRLGSQDADLVGWGTLVRDTWHEFAKLEYTHICCRGAELVLLECLAVGYSELGGADEQEKKIYDAVNFGTCW